MTRAEYLEARGWFGTLLLRGKREWRLPPHIGWVSEEKAEKIQLKKDAEIFRYIIDNSLPPTHPNYNG